MKNTNFMLLGGLTVAIAIETSQLHRRIALGTLKVIGSSPRRLMFGFMLISWFLSMWIANTAAAAMMIPIVLAVLEELERNETDTTNGGVENPSFDDLVENETSFDNDDSLASNQYTIEDKKKASNSSLSLIQKGMILCVPYACSVGGTATLTGTAPNLVLQEEWVKRYPDAPYSLSYTEWLGYNIITAFLTLLIMFAFMQAWYIGIRCKTNVAAEDRVRTLINRSWQELGKIRQEEILVTFSFLLLVLLWFFRKPGFMPGWTEIFPEPGFITDGVPALLIATVLFILPAERTGLICGRLENGPSRPVLTWRQAQSKMNWGVLLIIGGGYAMADASDRSGTI